VVVVVHPILHPLEPLRNEIFEELLDLFLLDVTRPIGLVSVDSISFTHFSIQIFHSIESRVNLPGIKLVLSVEPILVTNISEDRLALGKVPILVLENGQLAELKHSLFFHLFELICAKSDIIEGDFGVMESNSDGLSVTYCVKEVQLHELYTDSLV
jgi:hypothetical protein